LAGAACGCAGAGAAGSFTDFEFIDHDRHVLLLFANRDVQVEELTSRKMARILDTVRARDALPVPAEAR
jgi:hypothetical protein